MMSIARRLVAIASATFAVSAASPVAQKPAVPRPRAAPRTPPKPIVIGRPAYSFDRFDPSTETLPDNYRGHSIEQTFLRLNLAPPAKQEFETTAQYQARIPKPDPDEIFAFLMEANEDSGPFLTYDADAGAFELRVLDNNGGRDSSPYFISGRGLTMKKTLISDRDSMRGNALGAVVKVTERHFETLGVAFEEKVSGLGADRLHKIFIEVPPDRAKTVKDRIGLLFAFKPYLGSGSQTFNKAEVFEATIGVPYQRVQDHKYLRVGDILGVWVYDLATGTVFKKLSSL